MADVKEVKILKDGAMVTPKVLVDSIYDLDGNKFKDRVNAINTALGQKLKIGNFVTGTLNINQDNPTFVLPEMEIGELSVFSYNLRIANNTGNTLTTYIDVPSNGKYFTIFAEDLIKEGASDLSSNDRRMEIYSIPAYSKYDRHITSLSCPWSGYTTYIHILVIRFE